MSDFRVIQIVRLEDGRDLEHDHFCGSFDECHAFIARTEDIDMTPHPALSHLSELKKSPPAEEAKPVKRVFLRLRRRA